MNGSALPHRRPAGKVWLIGAGPGDAELLTLKAVRVLGEADVVLVDDLVNRDILAHARSSARVIGVGKRGGQGQAGGTGTDDDEIGIRIHGGGSCGWAHFPATYPAIGP